MYLLIDDVIDNEPKEVGTGGGRRRMQRYRIGSVQCITVYQERTIACIAGNKLHFVLVAVIGGRHFCHNSPTKKRGTRTS